MIQLLIGLPPEISNWVINNIPPEGTLTDLLRALITDSYYDENDAEADSEKEKS